MNFLRRPRTAWNRLLLGLWLGFTIARYLVGKWLVEAAAPFWPRQSATPRRVSSRWRRVGLIAAGAICLVIFAIAMAWPGSTLGRMVKRVNYIGTALFIIATPIWLLWKIVWTARAKASEDRRRFRSLAGLCPSCGYDLRSVPGICSECGTTVSGFCQLASD